MLKAVELIGFLTFTFLVLLLLDRLWLPKWSSPSPKVRDQRRGPRYAVRCPVTYAIHHAEGKAIVVDMSREGWRLQSGESLPVGTVLRLQIVVPSLAQPIPIEQAIVRWAKGTEFGIQLLALDVGAAAQLSDYLSMVERQGLNSALPSNAAA